MLTKGLFGFYLSNFLSLQPLLHIFIIGITISTKGRVLLHTVKFTASLMVCALFFQSDNASLAYQSDAECANQAKFQRSIAQKAAIGVVSVFFTVPPVKVLEMGFKHKFTYRESWNPALIAKETLKRKIKDLLMWIVGGAYISGRGKLLRTVQLCYFLNVAIPALTSNMMSSCGICVILISKWYTLLNRFIVLGMCCRIHFLWGYVCPY